MFLKTKEKKIKIIIVLAVIVLLVLIIMAVTNRRTVLDRVGKIINLKDTNKTEEILNGEVKNEIISTADWDKNKVNIVEDTEGVKVPVPKGYVASGADGEHTVNTGFVIYEGNEEVTTENAYEQSKMRNQWVWVPVSDQSRIYERDANTEKAKSKLWSYSDTGRSTYDNKNYEPGIALGYDNEKYLPQYDLQGMTKEQLLQELENEYEATIESIEKYGGFYIGRYETGNVGSGSGRNHDTPRQPVVQRMNTNIGYVTWYDAYNNMKNIQTNENVKSNIIWGNLWDETIQWLVDSGSKTYEEIKNSVTWGNHSDSEFDYTNVSGTIVHKKANSETLVPTGSSEQNKANNIYDMAGNTFEYTLEVSIYGSRVLRGGFNRQ